MKNKEEVEKSQNISNKILYTVIGWVRTKIRLLAEEDGGRRWEKVGAGFLDTKLISLLMAPHAPPPE